MIKELRKKLTLLYTVTTGTILTLVVAGLLFYNLRVSEKDALQTFQNQIVTVASRMQRRTAFVAAPKNSSRK